MFEHNDLLENQFHLITNVQAQFEDLLMASDYNMVAMSEVLRNLADAYCKLSSGISANSQPSIAPPGRIVRGAKPPTNTSDWVSSANSRPLEQPSFHTENYSPNYTEQGQRQPVSDRRSTATRQPKPKASSYAWSDGFQGVTLPQPESMGTYEHWDE